MRLIGKEHLLEDLNRKALQIAKDVAAEGGALVAGNICNTNIYDPDDPESHKQVRAMFEEQVHLSLSASILPDLTILPQVRWAKEAGVDFIIAETMDQIDEALIAVDVIKKAGLVSVVTLALGAKKHIREGYSLVEGFKMLKVSVRYPSLQF